MGFGNKNIQASQKINNKKNYYTLHESETF